MRSESKLLVFGGQALNFNATSLEALHTKIASSSIHKWASDVVASLPTTLARASTDIAGLEKYKSHLAALVEAFRTGTTSNDLFPLPNILLSPLVVISQLTDYLALVQAVEPSIDASSKIPDSIVKNAQTLGLCTGLLSASAVATSASIADLQEYGAISVRLAMLSGALVDFEDSSRGSGDRSTSFSATWSSVSHSHLESILKGYPEAYISVQVDEKRATITCNQDSVSKLQQVLKEGGIHISPVSLNGRFHWLAHQDRTEELIKFISQNRDLQLIDAADTILPIWGNGSKNPFESGRLSDIVIRAILTDQSKWFQTVDAAYAANPGAKVFSFGSERSLPPTIARKLDNNLIHVADTDVFDATSALSPGPDDRIAVIGMSCHVPNAEDVNEFWQVLLSGESQHKEVPPERFSMESLFREVDPNRKWYGNFVQDHDAFDHKFFKKSPREMGSTDPQHRIALQVAYQAVQQSGYFGVPDFDKSIGVYIGHAIADYEHNIRCYPANAYSATGNLKSLLAGRISHYFGWTGPSLTLDTACSSSSVAIHLACRAILSGEITGALAGGVTIFTSPEWYHNLAGASFLSTTGQCKSFDARGDGYCRGEGAGIVFLKKLSSAIADGDQILGVIAGTSVLQNQNCTPITVPNSPSLADLFRGVIKKARMKPHEITVVEAHGTGTSVGDPAEYDGIRQVLGGPSRPDKLSLTAVKGSIGHLEVASGIASVIKVLLMMHEGAVPPQASFQSINLDFKASPEDNMDITTTLKPWNPAVRSALINNYGASGSNASMVITEAPRSSDRQDFAHITGRSVPFWFAGFDANSLKNYVVKFRKFLTSKIGADQTPSLANLSFQLSRQTNRTLAQSLFLSANSFEDLDQKLSAFENDPTNQSVKKPTFRPVILCFGGQISTFVGLDKDLYESMTVLRKYLDECNTVCTALGLDSIYPDIFQRSPLSDIVKLQTVLFAMQYSCAKAWIGCGVEVTAIVGHSFGELTGLCISGTLSLKNAVQLVSRRAKIIQESTATERGSMMAVEGDLDVVKRLLAKAKEQSGLDISIACFNGPRSYTIAGSTAAIKTAEKIAKADSNFLGMRVKVLNVTNAFHSSLVEHIKQDLISLSQSLTYQKPRIRLERATEQSELGPYSSDYIYQHLRNPVYFQHAVQRLAQQYPNAIWLEAGSNSTITNMASKSLTESTDSVCQPMNITTDASYSLLVDATVKLWRNGLTINFWAHHKSQVSDYSLLLLPPYQFEKSRHWLEIKQIPKMIEQAASPAPAISEPAKRLITFFGYLDDNKRSVRFQINTSLPEFKEMVEAHIMANTVAVMPGMYPVEIAIDAISSLRPEFREYKYQPALQDMIYYCPLIPAHTSAVWFDATAIDSEGLSWDWKFIGQDSTGKFTTYQSASILFYLPSSPAFRGDFTRLSRLGSHKRCQRLLNGEADDVVAGRNIYRAFESVIDYRELYRNVTKLVGKDGESAGRVVRAHQKAGWLDSVLTDCFCQVAGVSVNLFSDTADFAERGIYIGDRVDRWVRAPGLLTDPAKPEEWEVFALNHRESDSSFVSDVFAFDARTGALYEAVLGIRYSKVPLAGIRKALNRVILANPQQPGFSTIIPPPPPQIAPQLPIFAALPTVAAMPLTAQYAPQTQAVSNGVNGFHHTDISLPTINGESKATVAKPSGSHIPGKTKEILSNLSGVEVEEIQDDSDLVEMGIDSLMAMELIREVDVAFKITLETDQLMDLTDFKSLVVCISTTLGIDTNEAVDAKPVTNGVNGHVKDNNGNLTNGVNGTNGHTIHADTVNGTNGVSLPADTVLDVFRATKAVTDDFIVKYHMDNYYSHVRPRSTLLCAAYIVEAFEKLGCSLSKARLGDRLARVSYLPKHERFMKELYRIIGPEETGLVDILDGSLIRTAVPVPAKSASSLLQEALKEVPDHAPEFRLAALTGCKLAECLTGKADGLQIIFGSADGRRIVSDVYGIAPINFTWVKQAGFFIEQLLRRLPATDQKINILEMGAGTGGTTMTIVPMLAALGVPVTYTFTDLSSSLVAAARKRFNQYPFVEFKAHNIEAVPAKELLQSQHIVLANACVHATKSLPVSLSNIRQVLRPDGLLMLVEETELLPWVEFVFGLLEGWWLFEDGRIHPQCSAAHWEKDLRAAGFSHVDYTDGKYREAQLQRIIFGFASDIRYAHGPIEPLYPITMGHEELTSIVDRQVVIDGFIKKYTAGFRSPGSTLTLSTQTGMSASQNHGVLVTGATGSLGSHLVAETSRMSDVREVFCINRVTTSDPRTRQSEAFSMRGIELDLNAQSKLQVLATDLSKPLLGLSATEYKQLTRSVTHIIHSAWPMSITRTTKAYEQQYQVMRNLIDLAQECASLRPSSFRFSFQFISSIGAVGYYPLWTGRSLAPEIPTTADTALPNGYADGKIICERMLEKTLRLYPDRFHAMAVRIAQITGSRTNGYWNPIEHFSFFVKSAQYLEYLPDLRGTLSWSPVNDVAGSLIDILLSDGTAYPIYQIENPVRQPWPRMITLLSDELDIPTSNIIPYDDWLKLVENCDASTTENPAKQLLSFWQLHFLRMSTGPLILDTKHSREHSKTMRESRPVEDELVRRYIRGWKQSGFLINI